MQAIPEVGEPDGLHMIMFRGGKYARVFLHSVEPGMMDKALREMVRQLEVPDKEAHGT